MSAFELGAFSPKVKPDVSGTCIPVSPGTPKQTAVPEPLFKCGEDARPAAPLTWTPERVKQLERLFLERLTTAEIGRRMGVSKNTIIGKLHRDGLAGTQKRYEPPHDVFNGGGCLWPHGDPGEAGFGFCGAELKPGKPYCAAHAALAYCKPADDDQL